MNKQFIFFVLMLTPFFRLGAPNQFSNLLSYFFGTTPGQTKITCKQILELKDKLEIICTKYWKFIFYLENKHLKEFMLQRNILNNHTSSNEDALNALIRIMQMFKNALSEKFINNQEEFIFDIDEKMSNEEKKAKLMYFLASLPTILSTGS